MSNFVIQQKNAQAKAGLTCKSYIAAVNTPYQAST